VAESQVSEAAVREVLDSFKDPETGRGVLQLEQVRRVSVEDGKVGVTLGLTSWAAPLHEATREELATLLREKFPGVEVSVDLTEHQRPAEKLGEIGIAAKSVIAVGSGKGGVGKSSISAFLAFGLARAGCNVGLMDADVYGPSIPHLIGSTDPPEIVNERIWPVTAGGVKVMSMGFMLPENEAVIWRGPMLHGAITQFLRDTDWGELDYLIIDLPPGTGDVALSVSQLLPLSGAVVVCTPQDVALLDAVRAITMFRKIEIDVLGVVENMSSFICSDCGARHEIFGSGGAKQKAAQMRVPFLGDVPIDVQLRLLADEGKIGAAFDHEPTRPSLEALCTNLAQALAKRQREKPALPTLTVLGQ